MDYTEWAAKFDPVPSPSGSLVWGREHYPELHKKASWDDTVLWSVLETNGRRIIVAGVRIDAIGYMRTRFGRVLNRDYAVTLPGHLIQDENPQPLELGEESDDQDNEQPNLLSIFEEEERLIQGDLHHHHWMSHDD